MDKFIVIQFKSEEKNADASNEKDVAFSLFERSFGLLKIEGKIALYATNPNLGQTHLNIAHDSNVLLTSGQKYVLRGCLN